MGGDVHSSKFQELKPDDLVMVNSIVSVATVLEKVFAATAYPDSSISGRSLNMRVFIVYRNLVSCSISVLMSYYMVSSWLDPGCGINTKKLNW